MNGTDPIARSLRSKRLQRLLTTVSALIFLTVFGLLIYAFKTHRSPPMPVHPASAVPVYVAEAHQALVPITLEAYGHMKAVQSVNLSFAVSGHITDIDAHAGERVNAGQIIARLDDEADVALLKSYEADLALNQATYERMMQIQKVGGISQQMLDSQKNAWIKARAQVDQEKVLIDQKTLRAPFEGVLGVFKSSKGAYLPSGTPLVELVQQAPLLAQYSIPADLRAELEIGQTVSVTTEAFPHQIFKGLLTYISPQVDPNSGTLTLQARIENHDYLLLPGMYVSLSQLIDADHRALVVPEMSLMTDILGQYVYVVQNGRARKVYVKVGPVKAGVGAVIDEGLHAGDEVIVEGQLNVDSGDRVAVLPGPPIAAHHVASN